MGAEFGWRATFFAMAILSAVACAGVLLSLTRGLRVQPLQFSSWVAVFKNPILLCIMAVTLLSMSGQFTVVSYLAPILREAFAATPRNIALMFAIFGVAGVLGNYLAAKAIGRFGVDRAILVSLFFLVAGIGMFGVFFGNYISGLRVLLCLGPGNIFVQFIATKQACWHCACTCGRNGRAQYIRRLPRAVRRCSRWRFRNQGWRFGKCRLDGAGLSCAGGRHVGCRDEACLQGLAIGGNGIG